MKREEFTLDWIIEFIANRIRILREAQNISAQTMSRELGYNQSYINKIENKNAKPSIEGLFEICEYLEVTFEEFFDTDTECPDKVGELIECTKGLNGDTIQLLIEIAKKIKG